MTPCSREPRLATNQIALCWFWLLRGHWNEARELLGRMLAGTRGLATPARAFALSWAGTLLVGLRDRLAQAELLIEEGLALSKSLDDKRALTWSLIMFGHAEEDRGDSKRAVTLAEEAIATSRVLGDPWCVAFALERLGEALRFRKEDERAVSAYEESLALSREIGDRYLVAVLLHDMGHIAQRQASHRRAEALFKESLELAREMDDRRRIAMCLEGLAGPLISTGRPAPAARLLGAAENLRETIGAPFEPVDRPSYARHVAALRDGVDETVRIAAWAEGRAMTLEQAVEYALAFAGLEDATGQQSRAKRRDGDPLAAREREVAILVAQGLSNRDIAARLVISERTAETHVQHILNKLGFGSRAQIAAWAAERGLTADPSVPAATSDSSHHPLPRQGT